MRCKSGKLFLPFCRLCIVLLILFILCFYCCWLVSALLCSGSCPQFILQLLVQTHMSKYACIAMSPYTACHAITDVKNIIKMYNTCFLEQCICLYNKLTCLQIAPLSLSTVLKTLYQCFVVLQFHTSVLVVPYLLCATIALLNRCQYLMSRSRDDCRHMRFVCHRDSS